jgi:hypothetical protein
MAYSRQLGTLRDEPAPPLPRQDGPDASGQRYPHETSIEL